jgi:nucleotide-binding universal stress UspA family protein
MIPQQGDDMTYGDPNDTMLNGYPPGHPAGTDTSISAAVSVGPIVLIAVDDTPISERVVRTAHRLFGDAASYLAINVGPGPYSSMNWASVWPVAGPSSGVPPAWVDDVVDGAIEAGTERAEDEAMAATRVAGLAQATPIGDVGDPTTAIIRAAHEHRVDVVVIGADARNWLSHLMEGSVERALLREADFAVLVVAAGPPGD